MGRRSQEKWDLLNLNAAFGCYPKTQQAATRIARARNIPIMIRHIGPRPDLADPHRVNHWMLPDGSRRWKTTEGEIITHTSGQWLADVDP